MILYWLIFIKLFLGGFYEVLGKNEKIKNRLYYITIGTLVLFFGTRGFIGWDWYFYYPSFMKMAYSYEPGYMLFSKVVGLVYKNYHFFVFINTLLDFTMIYFIFKRKKYKILTLALYFAIQGIPMEVDLMRNIKSILLFLLSIKYIEEKRFLPFLGLNILGFTFHITALLYIPMYFILPRKYDWRLIWGLFILGNLYYLLDLKIIIKGMEYIGTSLGGGMGHKILGYMSVIPKTFHNRVTLLYLERIPLFLLGFFLCKNEINKNSLYIWIYIFLFTSELSIASVRIGILFIYSVWFILEEGVERAKGKKAKIAVLTLGLTIGLLRTWNHLSFSGNKITYPYRSVLYDHETYEKSKVRVDRARKTIGDGHGRELLLQY
ncbi:EpsG family protein [Cetobacterium ceti]